VADQSNPKVSSGMLAIRIMVGLLLVSLGCQLLGWIISLVPRANAEVIVDGPVTVRRLPLEVAVKYLDNHDWQQDKKYGSAYTHWAFIDRTQFDTVLAQGRSNNGLYVFQIQKIETELTLPITMWLPYGVSAKLHEHEDGHCTICRDVYGTASKVALSCAKNMIARSVSVRAPSLDDARVRLNRDLSAEFSSCYTKNTDDVAQEISVIYDRITNHGINGVATTDGVVQATKEYWQGQHGGSPAPNDKAGSRVEKRPTSNDKADSRVEKALTSNDKADSSEDRPLTSNDKASSRGAKPAASKDKPSSRAAKPAASGDIAGSRAENSDTNGANAGSRSEKTATTKANPSSRLDKSVSNEDHPSSPEDKTKQ